MCITMVTYNICVLTVRIVGQEVVKDGFNGHSRGDLEENTDDTCMAGMKAT
jgi:hypothetical protein